jgi:hypothetical protein
VIYYFGLYFENVPCSGSCGFGSGSIVAVGPVTVAGFGVGVGAGFGAVYGFEFGVGFGSSRPNHFGVVPW